VSADPLWLLNERKLSRRRRYTKLLLQKLISLRLFYKSE